MAVFAEIKIYDLFVQPFFPTYICLQFQGYKVFIEILSNLDIENGPVVSKLRVGPGLTRVRPEGRLKHVLALGPSK